MNKVQLSAEQVVANRSAIHNYIIEQTKINGGLKNSPVILVPQFEEVDGQWVPVQGNGVRPTSKEGLAFMRLGMAFMRDNLTAGFHMTNTFADETQLAEGLALMGISVGDQVPGKVLIVQESLTPFNSKNPERDLKVAGASGIPCTFQGEHQGVTYDNPAPIYRRVSCKPVGTASVTIEHTNKEEISKWAQAANVKVNTSALKGATKGKK